MKKFKALTLAFTLLFAIGFSACTEDETMGELMDNTELAKPTSNDNDGGGTAPGGGGSTGGNN